MSCITKGRAEPCKDNIGGIRKVYLFSFVKYSYSQIVGTRGVNITSFPVETPIYEYQIQGGSFSEDITNDENGVFFTQNLSFSLTKVELAVTNELAIAEKIDLSYIVEFNDGSLKVGGLWKGAKLDFNIDSGGSKGSFNGYQVTITGQEQYAAAYISSTDIITGSDDYIFQSGDSFIFQDANNYIFQ